MGAGSIPLKLRSEQISHSGSSPNLRVSWVIRTGLPFFVAALGGALIYVGRFRIKGDGISYLDLAGTYLRGDWATAANTCWSPVYPAILSIVLGIFRPGPYTEFPIVQLVNFIIFLAALGCFLWVMRQLPTRNAEGRIPLTAYGIGLALFAFTSLIMIAGPSVTPDMLLLAVVLAISGVYLRMKERGWSFFSALCLGALCGMAYLTKSAFFPVSVAFLVILGCLEVRREKTRAFLPLVGFLLVSLPWVAFLSYNKGRPTYSDIGWINYCLDVGGCTEFDRLTPTDVGGLVLFRTYPRVTYPPWFDLSELREGARVHLSLARQQKATIIAILRTCDFFANRFLLPFWFTFAALVWLRARKLGQEMWRMLPLAILSFLQIAAYLLTHIEPRYIAPAFITLSLPVISVISLERFGRRQLLAPLAIVSSILLFASPLYHLIRPQLSGRKVTHEVYAAAQSAMQAGFRDGDRVVVVGDGVRLYWPHLLRMHVAGEISNPERFWGLSDSDRQGVICRIAQEGIPAIVTSLGKPKDDTGSWIEIDPGRSYALKTACPSGH
jgi:hypothetical protein